MESVSNFVICRVHDVFSLVGSLCMNKNMLSVLYVSSSEKERKAFVVRDAIDVEEEKEEKIAVNECVRVCR